MVDEIVALLLESGEGLSAFIGIRPDITAQVNRDRQVPGMRVREGSGREIGNRRL